MVVATNQSGIARGYFSVQMLDDIHQKMHCTLLNYNVRLDGVYYCPHLDQQCDCRKPKPGMLFDIAKDFNERVEDIIFIGDSLSDVDTALQAGCRPVLLESGKQLPPSISIHTTYKDIPRYINLASAVDNLLA